MIILSFTKSSRVTKGPRGEFPVISVEAAKAVVKALSEQSVAADPGLPGKALLWRTAVKYPHGAVRLARGLIRLSRTPPRAFSIHLNNGQAGNPLNWRALSSRN